MSQLGAPLRASAMDALPVARLVLTEDHRISDFNERAGAILGLEAADVGRPVDALAIGSGAGELRTLIEQAHACRQVLMRAAVKHRGSQMLDIIAVPLPPGTGLIVLDTPRVLADKELETANEELKGANEALEHLNAQLQAANESLRERIAELERRGEK